MTALTFGIRENRAQFTHQLIEALQVGFAIGMMRTVIPVLAETKFGVARIVPAVDSLCRGVRRR